jgi:DNA-binding PadR family transcriptional regulator
LNDLETKLAQELRRGVLQIAVLALMRRPTYGYQLLKDLDARGLPAEEGTLYPILRRLEKQGLIGGEWDTNGTRPRKYYRMTAEGERTLGSLLDTWKGIHGALAALAGEEIRDEA